MKFRLLLVMIIMLFVGCSDKSNDSEAIFVKPFKNGDIITLKGVEGGEKKLKRVDGGFVLEGEESKVLMIDIFGTFCPPCQEEAPNLTNFQIKYSDKVTILGLIHLEEVTDGYVVDNFTTPYNAHYFIANSKENKRIVETILQDLEYESAIQIPFKVVLKNGQYQEVTDVWQKRSGIKYYLGKIGIETIKEDIDKIIK